MTGTYISDSIAPTPVNSFPRKYAVIIAILLLSSILGVLLSIVQAIAVNEEADRSADRAALQSARNRVDLLESRIRNEEGHECIARFQRDVVIAFAEERQHDVPGIVPCVAEDLPQIREELADARKRLAALVGPDDSQLEGDSP